MKKYLNISILSVIFILSVYLRLDAYILNNSFFTDEVLLFVSVFSKNYAELIQPLPFFQAAPYLFLVLSKFICSHIGISELCLRFIPFVSSIISVFLFYKLTKIIFNSNLSRYIALFTFGINYQLLFYSQTFKQYSLDVLVVIMFLYFILKYFNNLQNIKHYTLFGLSCLFGVFISFPVVILMSAIFIALFIMKKDALKLLYSALYPICGLIIYYLSNLKFVNNSVYLHNYWGKGFQIFSSELYKMNFDFLFTYYSFPFLLVVLLLIGFYFLYKNNKLLFFINVITIFNTLLLAYLKIYPCERRLILFLLPILLIAIIYPLDNLKKNVISYIIVMTSFIFFGCGYFNFSKNYFYGNISYLRQDVKPLLQKILNKGKNDKIYLYYGAIETYSYYSLIYPLPKDFYFEIYPEDENFSELSLQKDLENLSKGTYYLLFIKGTGTYEKDVNYIEPWLKSHYKILSIDTLKSTKLIKFKVE